MHPSSGVGASPSINITMTWTTKNIEGAALIERSFVVESGNRSVPGTYWTPTQGRADYLCLIGHLASGHKKADYVMQLANGLAELGIASMAIDGPGHGDRITIPHPLAGYSSDLDALSQRWEEGGGTDGIVADWTTALDFIESEYGNRRTGYWGLQLGTMMGLPFVASDPRISIAVLGLMGNWGPNADDLMKYARSIRCNLRFIVQWDDQKVPRNDSLELFDALATSHKSLHANPGEHSAVPTFEVVGSIEYMARMLSAP